MCSERQLSILLPAEHYVSRETRGDQEAMKADLKRSSAVHLGVQGAECGIVASEIEAWYLPGRDPQV